MPDLKDLQGFRPAQRTLERTIESPALYASIAFEEISERLDEAIKLLPDGNRKLRSELSDLAIKARTAAALYKDVSKLKQEPQ